MGNSQINNKISDDVSYVEYFDRRVVRAISKCLVSASDGFTNLRDFASFRATCKYILKIVNEDKNVWEYLCKTRYRNLTEKKQTAEEWKQTFFERVSGVVLRNVVLVGDRNQPERKIVVELTGKGECFVGEEGNLKLIQDYRSVIFDKNRSEGWMSMIPFTSSFGKRVTNRKTSAAIRTLNFVDVSSYDPTVLFLSSDGVVLESLFLPSYITNYDEFQKPAKIEIDSAGKIVGVRATAAFSFAWTDKEEIFAWTVVDHESTKLRISACEIQLIGKYMNEKKTKIVDVIDSDGGRLVIISFDSGEILKLQSDELLYILINQAYHLLG